MPSEKEIEAAMSAWSRALADAPDESVYERRRRCIHAALSAAARVREEDNSREPAMSVEAPERIWIDSKGVYPYFYPRKPSDYGFTIAEYVRADKLEELTAALASERTTHAETRWARDEAFQKFVDANEARIDAKTRLAQALKALKQIEQQLDYGQIDMALHITRCALEGGE